MTIPSIASRIAVIDGHPTTTTLDIADVYGKRHDDVLRIVRKRMTECPKEWRLRNFTETGTERENPSGGAPIKSPVIRMTKKGFHFVVGKFTGVKAVQHQIAFADEFERMETELLKRQQQSPVLPLVDERQQRRIDHLQRRIIALQGKVIKAQRVALNAQLRMQRNAVAQAQLF
jgi:Rha family phage regulatory protein